jgi:hypothetical protein
MIFNSIVIFGYDYPLRMSRIASFGYFEFIENEHEIIPNHAEIAVKLLIEQFKHSTNLHNLIKCYVNRMQELENVIQQFNSIKNINQAFGKTLEILGSIVGQDREGRDDSNYRNAIRLKILLNHSYGQPEILILALKSLVNAKRIKYAEFFPACAYMDFNTYMIPQSNLQEAIESIAIAGVKIILKFSNVDDHKNLRFRPELGIDQPADSAGFSERDNGTLLYEGGKIFDLI